MIQTLKEYQLLAARTCPDLGSLGQNLSHMVMGMCSELSELEEAYEGEDKINAGEEIADVYWYLANYCNLREIVLSQPNTVVLNLGTEHSFSWYIFEITDLVKKFVAYGKEINKEKEFELVNSLNDLLNTQIYQMDDKSLFQLLTNNIDKLKIRYPASFNNEDAINRNLSAERKELEK